MLPGSQRGQLHGPLIPDRVHKVLEAHPGQLAFRAEGHGDGAGQVRSLLELSRLAGLADVHFKLPGTVQVHPVGPNHLGPGILHSGNIHRNHSPILKSLIFPFSSRTSGKNGRSRSDLSGIQVFYTMPHCFIRLPARSARSCNPTPDGAAAARRTSIPRQSGPLR